MDFSKFYPLVDCESDGTEKVPMFFAKDEHSVAQRNEFYLAEVIPHHYRLCTGTALAYDLPRTAAIHCPYCGTPMRAVVPAVDIHKLSLYVCPKCR